jgi:competence protein ComGE
MLRNNNGFFLLELLLSLSALLMICLFLMPLLVEVRAQSRQLEIGQMAQQLMYEELQARLIDSQTFTDYTFIQNNIDYKVIWKDTGAAGQKEVCVTVEKNSFLPEKSVCGILE